MAHLLEHMAFKGTERVGTQNYAAEAPLLDALDEGMLSPPATSLLSFPATADEEISMILKRRCDQWWMLSCWLTGSSQEHSQHVQHSGGSS